MDRTLNAQSMPERFSGMPVVVITYPDGSRMPAPYLMSREDVAAFFGLHDSATRFPAATIRRYRNMGLKTVRVGRRVWYRLDDVLNFLDLRQKSVDS